MTIHNNASGALLHCCKFVPMEITVQLIRELSALSRLELREEDLPVWQADLQKMVAFVEQLQRVDTSGVQPLLHMGAAAEVLREDVVSGSVSQEVALQQAPDAVPPYFSVPKVIATPLPSNQEN
jgi:aspartyl-tRNA(Asn)/glutamyl-tRNA(Gln) amidotransferase subunit C